MIEKVICASEQCLFLICANNSFILRQYLIINKKYNTGVYKEQKLGVISNVAHF